MNIFYPSLAVVFIVVCSYYFLLDSHKNVSLVNTSLIITNIALITGSGMPYMKIAMFIFVIIIEIISFLYIWSNQEFKRDVECIAISQIIVFLIYIFTKL